MRDTRPASLPLAYGTVAIAVAAGLALAGCNIIIKGKVELGDFPPYMPVGNGDCSAIDEATVPTARLLVFVRMTRATLGAVQEVDALVANAKMALYLRGYVATHVIVSPLVAEEGMQAPLYWESCAQAPPVSLFEALTYYAKGAPTTSAATCEHDLAAYVGRNLASLQPSYPDDLAYSFAASSTPFMSSLGALVVVLYIDLRSREHELDECQLEGQAVPEYFVAAGDAGLTWLSLAGTSLPPAQVAHLAIATSESGESDGALVARCQAMEGIRPGLADFIAPSAHRYFGPFTAAVAERAAGMASYVDLCEALSVDGLVQIAEAIPGRELPEL